MRGDHARSVGPALVRALPAAGEGAKWEALDLVARKGRLAAPDLLRGRSAELAFSPLGFDQLLSLALDQVALALEEGALFFAVDLTPLLRPICLPGDQEAAVRNAAGRGGPRNGLAELARASAWIDGSERDHAALCRMLWRETRIPADVRTRAAMLQLASQAERRGERPVLRLLRGR